MKGFALAGIYGLSLGLIVAGLEQGRIPEDWGSALYLLWASAGLVIVAIGVLRRDDK